MLKFSRIMMVASVAFILFFGCEDYTANELVSIGPKVGPTPLLFQISQPYALPFKAEDLGPGERYVTGNHKPGIQGKGEDFGANRYTGSSKWSGLKKNTTGTQNSDYVVYNKPFYAIEDGVVCGCWRNAPENPAPGERHPNLDQLLMAGGGNHLWVLQDDGAYVLYAHAIPGTIPSSLCPYNAAAFASPAGSNGSPDIHPNVLIPEGQRPRVKRGQFLGRVGNSGTSSGPHLHMHGEKDGSPAPLTFKNGLISPFNASNEASINHWIPLNGGEIPDGNVLIWPPRSLGSEYTRHQYKASEFQRLFDHLADSGFELEWLDGYSVNSQAYLNFNWRPGTGKAWKAHFGLTGAQYQNAFDNRGGLAPTFVDSYTINGVARYNVIFKQQSGGFIARHDLTYNQHVAVMNQAKQAGLQPLNISVASVNNQRRYTVLYRPKNYGGYYIKSQVTEANYQKLFDDYDELGYSPVFINGYKHQGEVYLTTVFAKNGGGSLIARHAMSNNQVQNEWESAFGMGFRTQMITAFDGAASQHRFAALWRK